MPPNAEPTNKNPSHHVTLEEIDGDNKFGFLLSDGAGEISQRGIKRDPMQRTSLKTAQGSTRYSDFSEPFSPIDQDDWIGGRANEDFEKDRSRFYDSQRVNTWQGNRITLGPQEKFCTGVRSVHQYLPGNVNFQALTGNQRWLARKFTTTAAFTEGHADLLIRYLGTLGAGRKYYVSIRNDSAGSPGTSIGWENSNDQASFKLPGEATHPKRSKWWAAGLDNPTALSATTTYWVMIRAESALDDASNHWEVAIDTGTTGNTKQSVDGSTWVDYTGGDMYFRVVDAEVQREVRFFEYKEGLYAVTKPDSGAPQLFLNGDRGTADSNAGQLDRLIDATKSWTADQHNGKIVIIQAGTGQFELQPWRVIVDTTATELIVSPDNWRVTHDTTTEYVILGSDEWIEITGHGLTQPVTDVLVGNKDVAYFLQGDATTMRRFRGYTNAGVWTNEFAADGSNVGTFAVLSHGEQDNPRIWTANVDQSTVRRAQSQSWGVNLTFDPFIKVGSDDEHITGLETYGSPEVPYVLKEGSVWAVSGDQAREMPLREMRSVRSEGNGRAHLVHGVYLYFSLLHSSERYYRNNLDDLGPSRDAGMPAKRQGPLAWMVGYPGIWFSALDAGAGFKQGLDAQARNVSSIMVWNQFGWHELYRATLPGHRIRDLFFQVIPGDYHDRLWFSQGRDVGYLPFPSMTLDPTKDVNYRFTHEGSLTTSWIYANLQDVQKLFYSLKVFAEQVSGASRFIEADYQLDGADDGSAWVAVGGSFDTVPVEELRLSANDDVTGRRIRIRLRIYTNNASFSPRVKATVLECLPRIATKFRYTMSFVAADDQPDLQGKRQTYSVEQLIDQLDLWANNPTVLRMRTNFRPYDDKRVLLDPSSLRPFLVVPAQKEKQIGVVSVEEI